MAEPNGKPCVVEFEFDLENAKQKLDILYLRDNSVQWRFFVAFNRLGKQYFEVLNSMFPHVLSNMNDGRLFDIVVDVPADAGISKLLEKIEETLKKYILVTKEHPHLDHRIKKFYKMKIRSMILSISIGNTSQIRALQYSFHTERSLVFLKQKSCRYT